MKKINIEHLFKNWTLTDYVDFLGQKETIEYYHLLKELGFELSLENITITRFRDLYLEDETHRNNEIYNFINRLEEEYVNELSQRYSGVNFSAGDNSYQKLANYYCHNVDEFLSIFDIEVIKPVAEIFEPKSIKTIQPKFGLREYQKQCCVDLEEFNQQGRERVLLHLPTGAGKTRTAINYACEYLRNNPEKFVVWLADTTELCDQALQAFEQGWKYLGDRELSRFAMYGNREFSLDGIYEGFAILGLQKFRSLTNKEDIQRILPSFKERVGLIIFDEAHKALAPSYRLLTELLMERSSGNVDKPYLVGLSATPGRSLTDDDENNKLSELFYNNKVSMRVRGYSSPIEYLQEKGYLAKAIFRTIDYDISQVNFALFNQQSADEFINDTLAKDINRNNAIIKYIQEHFISNPHSKNIVFSCSLEHCQTLELWLNGLGIVAKSISGNTDTIVRKNYIDRYVNGDIQVLINYGVLTAGFDAPCTDAVFITRPTNSLVQYLQMAGRAMRGVKSGGHAECVIYTVNDEIEAFNNMFKAFDYWNNNWN